MQCIKTITIQPSRNTVNRNSMENLNKNASDAKIEKYIFETLSYRAKELLSIPQVFKEYQSKESEVAAKDWILKQALITLMYTPEERKKMAAIKSC